MESKHYRQFFTLCLSALVSLCLSFSAFAEPDIKWMRENTLAVGLYEKFEVTTDIVADFENPYDPEQIEILGIFLSPKGKEYIVPGFYYQGYRRIFKKGVEVTEKEGEPLWKIRFSPDEVGLWEYHIKVITPKWADVSDKRTFRCTPSSNPGFIKPSGKYFVFSNGTSYFPIGENLCWSTAFKKTSLYDFWGKKLKENGANLIRVWMAPWSFIPEWKETGLGNYNQKHSFQLDYIFELSNKLDIYMILCLLDHGQFSEKNNPKWKENPYNQANGGPCKEPADFLTDEQAKRYFKMRLRYIVSRWGYSTNLMAWEWINEIDLSDMDTNDYAPWIKEMTAYIQSIEPAEHMFTASFHHEKAPDIWSMEEMSFVQIHIYDKRDVPTALKEVTKEYVERHKKPVIIGEFGWQTDVFRELDDKGIHFHDGLWSSALSLGAGSALIWYWDSYIEPYNLYFHFKALSEFTKGEEWAGQEYSMAEAEVDNENLLFCGVQNSSGALIWIKNKNDNLDEYIAYIAAKAKHKLKQEWREIENDFEVSYPPVEIEAAVLKVRGLKFGLYAIQWWDTYTGKIVDKQKVWRGNGGKDELIIEIPKFSKDIAVKIKKESWWRMF